MDEPPVPLNKLRARESQIAMLMERKKAIQEQEENTDNIWIAKDVEPWIPVGLPPISRRLFVQGEGFDFYIDAARYLPDNITLTRVEAFGSNRSKSIMYAKLKKDVDPRSKSCRNAIYNARKEFRWQSEKAWDPTMTIVIQARQFLWDILSVHVLCSSFYYV